MADTWVEAAFESALTVIDNGVLVRAAGMHVQPEGEWTTGKVRPSLLGGECDLQTVKQYRGHGPQPGANWMASRNGRPDANSNLVFARGFLGEGLVVAALKEYSYLIGDYEILGCAPELVFSATDTKGVEYEGHPDLMTLRNGEIELIQVKTPSVWAFERAEKQGALNALTKYKAQVVAEMYLGRKMGIDIVRSYLFMMTWEGWQRGKTGVRVMVVPMDWDESMVEYVETEGRRIKLLDTLARTGKFPDPANREDEYSKWPCSYCRYARTSLYDGQVICTENEKWEQ